MVDPFVLVALGLLCGAPLALAPLPTIAAALGSLVALRRHTTRKVLVLAAVAMVIGGLRARAALRRAEGLHASAVATLTPPARCDGEGRVVGSPVVLGRPRPGIGGDQARVDIELTSGTCRTHVITSPLVARVYGAPEDLVRGDRVAVVADLAPLHLFREPELSDPRPAIARSRVAASGGAVEVRVLHRTSSIGATIDAARARVRARIEHVSPRGRSLGSRARAGRERPRSLG
jgi:competence protein ComEC